MKTRGFGILTVVLLAVGTAFGFQRKGTDNPPGQVVRWALQKGPLTASQVLCALVDTDGNDQPEWLVSLKSETSDGVGLWIHYIAKKPSPDGVRSAPANWLHAINWEDKADKNRTPLGELWMNPETVRAVEIDGHGYFVQACSDTEGRDVLRFYHLSDKDWDKTFSVVLGRREGESPNARQWRAFYEAVMGGNDDALRLHVVAFPAETVILPGFDFTGETKTILPQKIIYRTVKPEADNAGWQAFAQAMKEANSGVWAL